MRKIEKRGIFCLILAALLGIGLALFCFRFVVDGGDWASYPNNRHLYSNEGVLKGGTILDRDGDVLSTVDENGNRTYYADATVRRATLHAVGDPAGNIGAGALTAFADKLSGYNILTGAYSPLGAGNNLYLTIDAYLNNIAYQALNGMNGTVGVYNYKTGEILCMVSTPTFDPADPPAIDPEDPRGTACMSTACCRPTPSPARSSGGHAERGDRKYPRPVLAHLDVHRFGRYRRLAGHLRLCAWRAEHRGRARGLVQRRVRPARGRAGRQHHAGIRGCSRPDRIHRRGRHQLFAGTLQL